ncbi:MAG: ATP-binding cassette domain-containing protein [Desulfobacteraceae bacterium]|nr:ATP-binding cassette domain-containing protein [Desulfobacteraceae bacterium]
MLSLDGISVTVASGDFITIIGSNGAGKSTLLNCIAGTHLADGGSIQLGAQDVSAWPEHKRARFVGRVFQDPLLGTCAAMTIEENLALARRRGCRRGLRMGVRSDDRDLFRKELKKLGLGLENRLKVGVGMLSGGQRQALTMLMATLVPPEVLLLDEHTAALDPKTARQILDLTETLVAGRQLTTLMVTHNMSHALRYGNRLIMLHQGRLILDIEGEEKRRLTRDDLLARFYQAEGEEIVTDRMLLG